MPRRKSWLLFLLIATALTLLVGNFVADWWTREPPNYTCIEEGLWLGGYVNEPPRRCDAVLNLCEIDDPYRARTQRWQPILDAEPAPTIDWLREQVEFIRAERADGKSVFVHCRNGVSRSAMVVAAYLMWREGWSPAQALEYLRSTRPIVRPHPAFMELLAEWERTAGD